MRTPVGAGHSADRHGHRHEDPLVPEDVRQVHRAYLRVRPEGRRAGCQNCRQDAVRSSRRAQIEERRRGEAWRERA